MYQLKKTKFTLPQSFCSIQGLKRLDDLTRIDNNDLYLAYRSKANLFTGKKKNKQKTSLRNNAVPAIEASLRSGRLPTKINHHNSSYFLYIVTLI